MKIFEREIFDLYSANDIQSMIQDIVRIYPQILEKNFYCEELEAELSYLDFIPRQLFNFDFPVCTTILLSTLDNVNSLPEDTVDWHIDSDLSTLITVLFWPQLDPIAGGEFSTRSRTHKVKPGHIVILPADETHRPENYISSLPRISLKWMFCVSSQEANLYRD